MKRSLLAIAVTAFSFQAAQAAPFLPMDARGMAMGNTGVASAKRAHAPAYNPSLLSQAREKDDFSLVFPQLGVWISDEKAIIDEADKINDDIFPRFEALLDGNGPNSLENLVNGLSNMQAPNLNLSITGTPTSPTDIDNAKTELQTALGELRTSQQTISNTLTELHKNIAAIDAVNKDLNRSLSSVSGNPISARLGLSGAVAVPSKKFAVAVSLGGSANISAKVTMSNADLALLDTYIDAAEGYVNNADGVNSGLDTDLNSLEGYINALDPNDTSSVSNFNDAKNIIDSYKSGGSKDINNRLKNYTSTETLNSNPIFQNGKLNETDPNLTSTAEVVGVGVVDVGVSFSRIFDIAGEKVAVGVTPKIQKIYTFHYGNQFDNFDDLDSDEIEQYRKDYTDFNLDVGASYAFGEQNQWVAGVVIKNLLGGSYDYMDTVINIKNEQDQIIGTRTLDGGKVKLNQQVRGGIAYQSKLVNLAFDLDLLKNDPVAYEAATQYASFGAEFDAWGWAQLRAGYRMNLKDSSMKAVSAGIGFSPFDVFVLDITGVTNPSDFKKESGAILELGLNF